MKTAMQQLIQLFENENHFMDLEVIRLYLEKEKEQLKNTYKDAMESGLGDSEYYENEANEYYQDTFSNKVE